LQVPRQFLLLKESIDTDVSTAGQAGRFRDDPARREGARCGRRRLIAVWAGAPLQSAARGMGLPTHVPIYPGSRDPCHARLPDRTEMKGHGATRLFRKVYTSPMHTLFIIHRADRGPIVGKWALSSNGAGQAAGNSQNLRRNRRLSSELSGSGNGAKFARCRASTRRDKNSGPRVVSKNSAAEFLAVRGAFTGSGWRSRP